VLAKAPEVRALSIRRSGARDQPRQYTVDVAIKDGEGQIKRRGKNAASHATTNTRQSKPGLELSIAKRCNKEYAPLTRIATSNMFSKTTTNTKTKYFEKLLL